MAQHEGTQTGSSMDYSEHEATYKFFTGLVKWGSAAVVLLLILMAAFLVH